MIVWSVEPAISRDKHGAPLHARVVTQATFQKDWPCNAPSVMRASIHLPEPLHAPNAELVSPVVQMELPRARLARLGPFPIEPARPVAQTAPRASFKAQPGSRLAKSAELALLLLRLGPPCARIAVLGHGPTPVLQPVRAVLLGLSPRRGRGRVMIVKLASFPTQIMGLCVRSARPRLDQRTRQPLELPAVTCAFRIITCPT